MLRYKILPVAAIGLLFLSTAGCTENGQTAEKKINTLPHSSLSTSSETAHNTSSSNTVDMTSSSVSSLVQEQQTASEQAYSSTAEKKTQTPAKESSSASKTSESPKPRQEPNGDKPAQPATNPVSSAQSTSAPTYEPEPISPSKPDASQQPETSETLEPSEPEASKSAEPEPQFDINVWIDFAKQYAEDIGFRLNSQAVECWDNPIGANAKSKYLERDIKSRLNMYAGYGDITEIWVWAEEISPESYELYIGYA